MDFVTLQIRVNKYSSAANWMTFDISAHYELPGVTPRCTLFRATRSNLVYPNPKILILKHSSGFTTAGADPQVKRGKACSDRHSPTTAYPLQHQWGEGNTTRVKLQPPLSRHALSSPSPANATLLMFIPTLSRW